MTHDTGEGVQRRRLTPEELLNEVLADDDSVSDGLREELAGAASIPAGDQRTEAIRSAIARFIDG
jgi:hypothetical protein